jgi:hypothetical protein
MEDAARHLQLVFLPLQLPLFLVHPILRFLPAPSVMDLRMMPPNFQLPPPLLLLLLAPLQAPARGKPPTELWTRVKRFNPQSSRNRKCAKTQCKNFCKMPIDSLADVKLLLFLWLS